MYPSNDLEVSTDPRDMCNAKVHTYAYIYILQMTQDPRDMCNAKVHTYTYIYILYMA